MRAFGDVFLVKNNYSVLLFLIKKRVMTSWEGSKEKRQHNFRELSK
jgi:hypothetical protein